MKLIPMVKGYKATVTLATGTLATVTLATITLATGTWQIFQVVFSVWKNLN